MFDVCCCTVLKGPKFCHPGAALGDIGFKLFIKKQNSERTFDSPHFLPRDADRETCLRKGAWLGPAAHPHRRKAPRLSAQCPVPLSEWPGKDLPALCGPLSLTACKSPIRTPEIQHPIPPFLFCPKMPYIPNGASLCWKCSCSCEFPICMY